MARLSVGKVIPLIAFGFKNSRPCDGFMFSSYRPWANELELISLMQLTVTEHHRVRDEYAEVTSEADRDGYILLDAEQNVWHNEYPHASSSFSSDGLFTAERHIAGEGAQEWLSNNENALLSYQFLDYYLNNLLHGINQRHEEINKKSEDESLDESFDSEMYGQHTHLLRCHYNAVVVKAEKDMDCLITSEPLTRTDNMGVVIDVKGRFKHYIHYNTELISLKK